MRPLNVLVIDDDQLVCQSLSLLLETEHHTATIATDASDGLRKFHSEAFDLVMVDYFMPGMNGQDLAEAIKKESYPRPVVLISGFPPRDPSPAFDKVILKPFSLQELRQTLATLFNFQNPIAGMA